MGSQHKGSYKNPDTCEARVFGVLNGLRGHWFSTKELNDMALVVCASTYISSICAQLPRGLSIERRKERHGRRVTWWYRLVAVPSSVALGRIGLKAGVTASAPACPAETAALPFGE